MRGRSFLRVLPPLCGVLLFLSFPQAAKEGVLAGLQLSGAVLVPALFPVSVLAGCMIQMDCCGGTTKISRRLTRMLGLPEAGWTPLLMGLLGGFPLGAQLVAQAYENKTISKQDAPRLAGLSCNAGPAFLLGSVGGLFGSRNYGAVLLCIQLVSVGLTAFITREADTAPRASALSAKKTGRPFRSCLPEAIGRSALAMVRLTGAVCFFQAGNRCLGTLFPTALLPVQVQAALAGVLELTGGIQALSGSALWSSLPLASALVGWGGLCVHLQAAQALGAAELPLAPYLRIKGLQSVLCLGLGSIFLFFKKTIGF